MTPRPTHPGSIVAGAGVGLLTLCALMALSTPRAADARLAAAESVRVRSVRTIASAGRSERLAPGAVCDDGARGEAALRSAFNGAASAARVGVDQLRIERSAQPERMLTVLTVDLAAKGEEGPLKTLASALATTSPMLIVDELDLSSDGRQTQLRLKARALCRERRLP
jgi:hypothetical protein